MGTQAPLPLDYCAHTTLNSVLVPSLQHVNLLCAAGRNGDDVLFITSEEEVVLLSALWLNTVDNRKLVIYLQGGATSSSKRSYGQQ